MARPWCAPATRRSGAALADPLILTLRLDPASQAWFDRLRRAHFPPERNYLAAHLTLFHALPGAERQAIEARLRAVAAAEAPFPLEVGSPFLLGRGVAFRLFSDKLQFLHAGLAAGWRDWLGPQDRQRLRPHVTVQNKVAPETARALLAELAAGFSPFAATGEGLQLWHYRGGPWEAAGEFGFEGGSDRSKHKEAG